jgi:hypothetical protein
MRSPATAGKEEGHLEAKSRQTGGKALHADGSGNETHEKDLGSKR